MQQVGGGCACMVVVGDMQSGVMLHADCDDALYFYIQSLCF